MFAPLPTSTKTSASFQQKQNLSGMGCIGGAVGWHSGKQADMLLFGGQGTGLVLLAAVEVIVKPV